MSIKVKPAKAPYLAGKKDYSEMMKTETKIEALQRRPFRFSQFNKPYAHNFDYPSMENIYPDAQDVLGNYNIHIGSLQNLKNDVDITKWKDECSEGCGVHFTENLIRCDCQNGVFPSEVMICLIGHWTKITGIEPYVTDIRQVSQAPLRVVKGKEGTADDCWNRCYMLKLGDCKLVEQELCGADFNRAQARKVIAYACKQPIYGTYIRDSECQNCNTSLIISGSNTTVTSSTQQYTAGNCYQNSPCESSYGVRWSVSGSGASISQTGLLTTNAAACGSLTITATCSNCGISGTKIVTVTDAGGWVLKSIKSIVATDDGRPCGCVYPGPASFAAEGVINNLRYWEYWIMRCAYPNEPDCLPPPPPLITPTYSTQPNLLTSLCETYHKYSCGGYSSVRDIFISGQYLWEWQC